MTTDLYRHFSDTGVLLYVGISLSTISRTRQHKDGAAWFELIRNITIEKFETREAALVAERDAIRKEKPQHNIQHAVRVEPKFDAECEFRNRTFAEAREYAYKPVMLGLGTSWRVKWRNYLGESFDHDCETEETAKSLVVKLSKRRGPDQANSEMVQLWSQS